MKIYKFTSPSTHFVRTRILVSALCFLCALCGQSSAQDFKTVHDGIEYAEVTKEISGLKVNMNLLRLDLTKVRLDVHHAMDAAIGTEKTSSIATRHGAVAAINAGFFRLDTSIWAGDPTGVLIIDGILWSESSNKRIALHIENEKKVTTADFGHVETKVPLRLTEATNYVDASGIDKERKPNEIIVYNPYFGPSTLTKPDGLEILFSKCKSNDHFGGTGNIICRQAEIHEKSGNSVIPKDGRIVSIGSEALDENTKALLLQSFDRNHKKRTNMLFHDIIKFGGLDLLADKNSDTVAGVPQLIKNGKIDITWEQEKTTKSFVETRHPRTAVAKLKDGKFLMITVDGRSESSGGIGLQDLAEYLLSLGATDAMNLDGGGSTTMFLDGKVVNHPSDKEGERKVSDAILVTPRKKKN